MIYVLFIVGFILLIRGADFFVDGNVGIAKALKIPSVIIGLTVVALGTSSPELFVSVSAAIQGSSAIAVSNVLGSNVFNILMVVGISALIAPGVPDEDILKRDMPVLLVCSLIIPVFMYNGVLGRLEGIIMVILFVAYMTVLVKQSFSVAKKEKTETKLNKRFLVKNILVSIVGLGIMIIGSNMTVDNAVKIATQLGFSETFIGVTIIAVGTSLPELITSISAARKGDSGLSFGNAVGSNIFNTLFILGAASVANDAKISRLSLIDGTVMAVITLVFTVICVKNKGIKRLTGGLFVLLYVVYMVYVTIR